MFMRVMKRTIYEMAQNKSSYQSSVINTLPQIAQNWCLCKYCQLYRQDLMTTTYLHWRRELEIHLDSLNKRDTKPLRNKERWTREVILVQSGYTKPETVFKFCSLKFFHENSPLYGGQSLGITDEQQKEVCELFSKVLEDIVSCICSSDSVVVYVKKEFP